MSLPTRAVTSPSTAPQPVAFAGDPATSSAPAQAPRFSALLDLHTQAAAAPRSPSPQAPTPQPARAASSPDRRAQASATEARRAAERTAPARPPAPSSAPTGARGATAAAAQAERQAADQAQGRAEANRRASALRDDGRPAEGPAAAGAPPAEATDATGAADTRPADAVLQAWLGWQAPADPDLAAGGGTAELADAGTDVPLAAQDGSLPSTRDPALADRAGAAPGHGQALAAGPQAQAIALQEAGRLAAAVGGADAGADSPAGAPALEGLLPAQGLAMAPAEGRSPLGTAAPVQLALGTGPGQPDFAETFAMQLRQLAQDGVQQATLHLNPADLGSIAVQIAVDGGQAQVDFSASSAQTRELLGRHLDSLAASLQQAGLSLGSAQVRDQRQGDGSRDGHPDPSGQGRSSARPGASVLEAPTRQLSVRVPAAGAGRLDLFA